MANIVSDYVLDNGLQALDTLADAIYVCSTDPTNFTEATATFALGNKAFGVGNVFGAPAPGAPTGRKVSTLAITDGVVTVSGTATKWAVVDSANARLLANGSLASGAALVAGGGFTLPSFDIRLPNQ